MGGNFCTYTRYDIPADHQLQIKGLQKRGVKKYYIKNSAIKK